MKACVKCGGTLVASVENVPYTCKGFEVQLGGVTVTRCEDCEHCVIAIPNLAGLQRAICRMLLSSELHDSSRAFLRELINDWMPDAEIVDRVVASGGDEALKAFAALAMQRQAEQPSDPTQVSTRRVFISHTFKLETKPSREPDSPRVSWRPEPESLQA